MRTSINQTHLDEPHGFHGTRCSAEVSGVGCTHHDKNNFKTHGVMMSQLTNRAAKVYSDIT
jgi:hypothetical protein